MEAESSLEELRVGLPIAQPLPKSTNNSKRLSLSIATATALPASSPVRKGLEPNFQSQDGVYLHVGHPTNERLRKTPSLSSMHTNERSITPTLHKRTSMSSLTSAGGTTSPRSPAVRRTSSMHTSSTYPTMSPRSSLPPSTEEPVPSTLTAAVVAKEYFQKELEGHGVSKSQALEPEVVVILHDACYGHRYSRPRTSKASLNTIVERPERIQATVLGVTAAYVRLGGYHSEGRNAPHPKLSPRFDQALPFRIRKSSRLQSLLSPAVTQVHGVKWMTELKKMCEGAEAKLALNGKELIRSNIHLDNDEDEDRPKLHEGDLYLCGESLNALEGALGGVCEAVDEVFGKGGPERAFVCVRPPGHHCSTDYPSGFCWLNNVQVGIAHAALNHGLTHAVIIDFDLHHGDGSQAIAWDHNAKVAALPKNAPVSKKTAIGYFSLHDINSYPCEWGDEEKVRNASLCLENAHNQTIWNVHLQPWKDETEFWEIYDSRYSVLLIKAREFLRVQSARLKSLAHPVQPKAAIFISAGFDASEWESPGMQRHKVNVPTDFYARFTFEINKIANEEGLGVQGRVISVLEGGYSDRALTSGVFSHLSGLAGSVNPDDPPSLPNGLGHEMGRRLGQLDINDKTEIDVRGTLQPFAASFDPKWWTVSRLEELELLVKPSETQISSKKARNGHNPTYTSSTQSFNAKIVTPPANRRASSSTFRPRTSSVASSRPPSPPPPEVDWATATHELCKLLVPNNRQIGSCKPEDLNVEATRVRRNRQSAVGVHAEEVPADGQRMQLRDRKSKAPNYKIDEEEDYFQTRSDRRKTFAGAEILEKDKTSQPTAKPQAGGVTARIPPRRRVSAASSVLSATDDNELRLGSTHSKEFVPPMSRRRSSSSTSTLPIAPVSNQAEGPPVKKNHVTSKARSPSKTRSIVKTFGQPPVPKMPSAVSKAQKPRQILPAPTVSGPTEAKPVLADKFINGQEVDNLTSGLKKMSIKLNVPSKNEQVAREGKQKPTTKAPRKSIVPKAPTDVSAKLPVRDERVGELRQPQRDIHIQDHEVPVKLDQPPSHALSSLPSENITTNSPATFLPPTNRTIPASVAEPQLSVPQILPEQDVADISKHDLQPMVTPSPPMSPHMDSSSTNKHTRETLPVFTSSSPIPFAQPKVETTNMDSIVREEILRPDQPKVETGNAPYDVNKAEPESIEVKSED